jgi:hypothetical protein
MRRRCLGRHLGTLAARPGRPRPPRREGHALGLVALAADTDGRAEATAAEALARASGATWIPAETGHGYELLTDTDGNLRPVGARVLALAGG